MRSPLNASNERRLRIPMSREDRLAWEGRLGDMAILDHLGVTLDLQDQFVVRLHLRRMTSAHHGGLGTTALNGAIIAGMVDCAMSVAGILHFRGRTCGTLHLSIDFMKPIRTSQPCVECHAVRRAQNIVFLEARVMERGDRCCVSATGIVGLSVLKQASPSPGEPGNWLMPEGLRSASSIGAPVPPDDG